MEFDVNNIMIGLPEGFDDFFSLNQFIEGECLRETVDGANIKLAEFTKDKNYTAVFTSKDHLFVDYK